MVAVIGLPPIRQLRQCFLRASSLVIPPYRHIIHLSTTLTLYHKFYILSSIIFYLPIFISTNHLVHGNGLEVEILFNEIDLGIQSHSTFCPYKINIAYTALRTAPDSPSQPSYLGYIELF